MISASGPRLAAQEPVSSFRARCNGAICIEWRPTSHRDPDQSSGRIEDLDGGYGKSSLLKVGPET